MSYLNGWPTIVVEEIVNTAAVEAATLNYTGSISNFIVQSNISSDANKILVEGNGDFLTYADVPTLTHNIPNRKVAVYIPGLDTYQAGDLSFSTDGVGTFVNSSGSTYTGIINLNGTITPYSGTDITLTNPSSSPITTIVDTDNQPISIWTITNTTLNSNGGAFVTINYPITTDPYGLTLEGNYFYNRTGRTLSLFVSWQIPFTGVMYRHSFITPDNSQLDAIVTWLDTNGIAHGMRSTNASYNPSGSSQNFYYCDSHSHATGTYLSLLPNEFFSLKAANYQAGLAYNTSYGGTSEILVFGDYPGTWPNRTNIGVAGSSGKITVVRLN